METSYGFDQCYDGQLVVDAVAQIIVGTDLTACAADNGQLVPLFDQVAVTVGMPLHTVTADNGYVPGGPAGPPPPLHPALPAVPTAPLRVIRGASSRRISHTAEFPGPLGHRTFLPRRLLAQRGTPSIMNGPSVPRGRWPRKLADHGEVASTVAQAAAAPVFLRLGFWC